MNKEEYLKKLRSKIKKLPNEEINEAIEYYHQYFEEAGEQNTSKVIARLGSPAYVASQILADYAIKDLDAHKNTTKKNFSAIWFIILATIASPIALPLALVIILLALTLLLVCGVTILTFFLLVIGLPITGIFSIISGGAVIMQDWETSIFFIGLGFVTVGLGILLFSPFVRFSKSVSSGIVKLLKKVLDKFSNKRKEAM
ncbi:DUF1700 domain-containing protein [Bacillus sp. B1-b2]|uniref:DUF1700 domain-containing protein n=1 Tax=Bacillus sp. B1-b2 TaxID=2653201 RepID=UPI001261AA5F|nr:DUF1700 domain-containing protein [Bacillus sp. B1-b2]KAB7672141.1 DUF1700 domain-containing protein [Bacillus sp. B1-b2]